MDATYLKIKNLTQGMRDNNLLNGGTGGSYGAIGNAGGALIDSLDSVDGKSTMAGSVASGAMKGAGIGAGIAGPWGAAIGAVGGGMLSFFTRKHQQKEQRLAQERIEVERFKNQRRMDEFSSAIALNNMPVQGVQSSGFYRNGGFTNSAYKVEDGELLIANDRFPPDTDQRGRVKKIAPNTFKFFGDKHSDPSGGIGVLGGNDPFIDSLGQPMPSGFVLSNKLKPRLNNHLKNI